MAFCTSVGKCCKSIVFDRQQAIETQAVEHANKIEDEITKNSFLMLLKSLCNSKEELTKRSSSNPRKVRKQMMNECLATPHDKMPKYKSF